MTKTLNEIMMRFIYSETLEVKYDEIKNSIIEWYLDENEPGFSDQSIWHMKESVMRLYFFNDHMEIVFMTEVIECGDDYPELTIMYDNVGMEDWLIFDKIKRDDVN